MDATQQMLFNLQRFQIMTLFTSTSSERSVSDAYAYAWSAGVYPFLNETAPWHPAFEACFIVRETPLKELHGFLGDCHGKKRRLSYYELEDHYGIRGSRRPGPVWDQDRLVSACRYLYLSGCFDHEFWIGLMANDQFPTAAEAIMKRFDSSDCAFE